jgi:hypothetical protein
MFRWNPCEFNACPGIASRCSRRFGLRPGIRDHKVGCFQVRGGIQDVPLDLLAPDALQGPKSPLGKLACA